MNESAPPRRIWTRRGFIALGVTGAASICAPIRFGCYEIPPAYDQLANLSPTQARILHAVVDAMLPDDAPRDEALIAHVRFVDGYLVGMAEGDVSQLGWLLYLVEHLTLPFGPYWKRFTNLSRESRRDYLHGWQTSGMALRRLGLRSLKNLVFLSYYRTPDAFASIGYSGPLAPAWMGLPESRARYEPLLAAAGDEPHFER